MRLGFRVLFCSAFSRSLSDVGFRVEGLGAREHMEPHSLRTPCAARVNGVEGFEGEAALVLLLASYAVQNSETGKPALHEIP